MDSTIPRFCKPILTAEEWAENNAMVDAFEAAQERQIVEQRIKNAGIPRRYVWANIGACDPVSQAWASEPTIGLLLQGDVGRGKTYTACAAIVALASDRTVLFSTFNDVVLECRATFDGCGTEADVISRYSNVGVLVLDDLAKERPTEYSAKTLWSIIDRRYRNGKPTIITTQLSGTDLMARLAPSDREDAARAIASRISEYKRVFLTGPDRRLIERLGESERI